MKNFKDKIIIIGIIVILIVIAIIKANIIIPGEIQISGNSMYPTYLDTENVNIDTSIKQFQKGDVIAFKNKGSKLIKRVIGIPGDIIEIDNSGNIYINNNYEKELTENYPISNISVNKIQLSDNEYFVLGDNRNNSKDSRYFGPVKSKNILGLVIPQK